MDLYEIYEKWQSLYCAGYPMPKPFREEASEYFSQIFKSNTEKAIKTKYYESPIFRVTTVLHCDNLLNFDDLYYSFSSDLQGVKQFAIKDKNVRSDLFLIISKPIEAINFNALGRYLFKKIHKSRYYEENEIVSKLHPDSIISIYYLKRAEDIEDYRQKGIFIDIKDTCLDIKEIVDKYNLPIEWLKDN